MNPGAERTRLLRRDAEWAAAASDGRDIEHILSFWTEDAVVIPPGLPAVVGKEALRRGHLERGPDVMKCAPGRL